MMMKKSTKSRAEIVRKRRGSSKRSKVRTRRKGKRKYNSESPPVMVRGTKLATDSSKRLHRKRNRVKRRYDVALPSPGVEMRLPSVPQVKIGWRILSFLMAVGLSILLYLLWTSPMFQVGSAEVHGTMRLPEYMIDNALLIHNRPIFIVEPDALERQLHRTFPGLTQVSVRVGFPARVVVTVEERIPVLAWEQGGRLWWIDAQGIAFPPRGEVDSLPQVSASASPSAPSSIETESLQDEESYAQVFISPEMIDPILKLSDQAPKNTSVEYNRQYGFGWQDPRGWEVYFGDEIADIETKLTLYKNVIKKLQREGVQPVLISMEHINAPFYRLEQ